MDLRRSLPQVEPAADLHEGIADAAFELAALKLTLGEVPMGLRAGVANGPHGWIVPGTPVFWTDPDDGVASGTATVVEVVGQKGWSEELDGPFEIEEDTCIRLTRWDGGEVEACPRELRPLAEWLCLDPGASPEQIAKGYVVLAGMGGQGGVHRAGSALHRLMAMDPKMAAGAVVEALQKATDPKEIDNVLDDAWLNELHPWVVVALAQEKAQPILGKLGVTPENAEVLAEGLREATLVYRENSAWAGWEIQGKARLDRLDRMILDGLAISTGLLSLDHSRDLSLPRLFQADRLTGDASLNLKLPSLCRVKDLVLTDAIGAGIPVLNEVRDLDASNADELYVHPEVAAKFGIPKDVLAG